MCELYSTKCGADYWLQFDETDPAELHILNGRCVMVVARNKDTDMVTTDEADPRYNDGRRLEVHSSKLFDEIRQSTTLLSY